MSSDRERLPTFIGLALIATGISWACGDSERRDRSGRDAGVLDVSRGPTDLGFVDSGEDGGTPESDSGAQVDAGGLDSGTMDAAPMLRCEPGRTLDTDVPYCKTQLGALELKIFEPLERPPRTQLAVFLHGDTADAYFEDWGFESLLDYTMPEGIVLAAVLAPNRCSWWRAPDECADEIEDDGYNADQLATALGTLSQSLDLRTDPILYVGYSGGSTFLAGHFVPLHGDRFPGMVVANCGGEPPIFDFAYGLTPSVVAATRFAFTYGSEDFLAGAEGEPPYIQDAAARYEQLGFAVESLELPGYGHCDADYDWDTRTIDLWKTRRAP